MKTVFVLKSAECTGHFSRRLLFLNTLNGIKMKDKKFITMSEYRRLKAVKGDDWWINHDASPNGIGPVCLFCDRLIDWGPADHLIRCPVRRYLGTMYEEE